MFDTKASDWNNGEAIHGTGPTPFGAEAGSLDPVRRHDKIDPKKIIPPDSPEYRDAEPVFNPAWVWRCTTKPGKLYLHVFDWPQDGKLRVPLSNKVQSAKLLATGENLAVKNLDGKVVIEVPANAPDAAASVIALRIEGEPIIEPLPTAGAKATASASIPGNGPENAIDGTGEKRWRAPLEAKSAWLELELKQATTIGAFCLDEQILWPRVKQKFKLEAFVDGEWKILAEAKTSGHGIKQTITPVTAQKFRLTLECDKGSPGVAELLLCPTER